MVGGGEFIASSHDAKMRIQTFIYVNDGGIEEEACEQLLKDFFREIRG